jgi:CheY-like chemotaxis protein
MATTVMVVEDEPHIGALVRTYLERSGLAVLWVRSGEAALAELPRHPVRLVVLDIGLPGIDGFEVCRRLGGRVPVIMLTAHDEEPSRSRSHRGRRHAPRRRLPPSPVRQAEWSLQSPTRRATTERLNPITFSRRRWTTPI